MILSDWDERANPSRGSHTHVGRAVYNPVEPQSSVIIRFVDFGVETFT